MFLSSNSRKIYQQSGFTLLELLVVIAIIGVLASLAVPRFQNQLQKAKFVEVVNATGPFKIAVELCVQKGLKIADCDAGTNGIPADVGESSSKVVSSVNVADGVVTATGGNVVDNKTYILSPSIPTSIETGQTTIQSATGLAWTVSTGSTCLAAALCNP